MTNGRRLIRLDEIETVVPALLKHLTFKQIEMRREICIRFKSTAVRSEFSSYINALNAITRPGARREHREISACRLAGLLLRATDQGPKVNQKLTIDSKLGSILSAFPEVWKQRIPEYISKLPIWPDIESTWKELSHPVITVLVTEASAANLLLNPYYNAWGTLLSRMQAQARTFHLEWNLTDVQIRHTQELLAAYSSLRIMNMHMLGTDEKLGIASSAAFGAIAGDHTDAIFHVLDAQILKKMYKGIKSKTSYKYSSDTSPEMIELIKNIEVDLRNATASTIMKGKKWTDLPNKSFAHACHSVTKYLRTRFRGVVADNARTVREKQAIADIAHLGYHQQLGHRTASAKQREESDMRLTKQQVYVGLRISEDTFDRHVKNGIFPNIRNRDVVYTRTILEECRVILQRRNDRLSISKAARMISNQLSKKELYGKTPSAISKNIYRQIKAGTLHPYQESDGKKQFLTPEDVRQLYERYEIASKGT